jgi:hypothetical protein
MRLGAAGMENHLVQACALDATAGIMVMGVLVDRVLKAGLDVGDDALVDALVDGVLNADRRTLRVYARAALGRTRQMRAGGGRAVVARLVAALE